MSPKEFLKEVLSTYFIVVTLVVVCMLVLGTVFQPNQTFGYDVFFSPLLYGLLGVLPMIITYSKKELSIRQTLVRKGLQLLALEGVLMLLGFGSNGLSKDEMPLIGAFAISVFVIFVLVHLISYFLDCGQAARLNRELELLKQSEGQG